MGSAKDIVLRPIDATAANALVRRVHYSGKVVNNSQFHIGVFLQGKLEGAMQFGPSLDKRKIQGLVSGTGWNEFIELNRMAFSDALPRNSESRALGIALRMLKKHAPHLQWVISFADATQCGDGTIYRAAGFVLTGIKENDQIWRAPDGEVATNRVATDTRRPQYYRLQEKARTTLSRGDATKGKHITASTVALRRGFTPEGGLNLYADGGSSMRAYKEAGWEPLHGYQLRYIYFLDPTARERLAVPTLPYSEIERRGAAMYRGQPRAGSTVGSAPVVHTGEGGAEPTPALQSIEAGKTAERVESLP